MHPETERDFFSGKEVRHESDEVKKYSHAERRGKLVSNKESVTKKHAGKQVTAWFEALYILVEMFEWF